MRIGNGPRLVVPRPGHPGRRGWYGQWRDRGQAYDLHREQERDRLRRLPRWSISDCKPSVIYLREVPTGRHCRQVDGHGRSFGPRLTRDADLDERTRVRLVHRQEETLHSQLSRMLKRAHRLFIRSE